MPSTRLVSSRRRTERQRAGGFVARPCRGGSQCPLSPVVDWSRPGDPPAAGRWSSNRYPGAAVAVPSPGGSLILPGNPQVMTLVVAAVALLSAAAVALTSGDPRGLLVLALGAIGGWAAHQGLAARPVPAGPSESSRNPATPAQSEDGARPATPLPTVRPAPASKMAETTAVSTAERTQAQPATAAPIAPALAQAACVPPAAPVSAPAIPSVSTPAPAEVPVPTPVAVGAVQEPLVAASPMVALPDRPVEVHHDPASHGEVATAVPLSSPPTTHPSPPDASPDIPTSLPVEGRLQDLAARQRSSTADLRRSIRDVIERLEDEEPPAPRRRGKKPRH
jgi:hypothetical protein